MTVNQQELLSIIRINAFTYLRSGWYERIMGVYGSASEILRQSPQDISRDGGISLETATHFLKEAQSINPEKELEKIEKIGGSVIVRADSRYPARLADIPEPPIVLYVRGKADFAAPAIAVVGTRKPTAYGKRMAGLLAGDIGRAGAVVVSGLARGIDSVAHESAIGASALTWAVIGTGLGRCYPPENQALADKIIDKGGAIVSEFPFDRGPMPFHFPRRNRIISGLSCLIAVVEGTEKSGALITAKTALEQGRDVLAVPGPADSEQSAGPNLLIKNGAGVVTCIKDIIDAMPPSDMFGIKTDVPAQKRAAVAESVLLSEDERKVMGVIGSEEVTVDALVDRTGWTVPKLSGILFELEAKYLISCADGMYSKKFAG